MGKTLQRPRIRGFSGSLPQRPAQVLPEAAPQTQSSATVTSSHGPNSIVFTCSSYMSKGNRRGELLNAVRSFFEQHDAGARALVGEFVIINEYDPAAREDYAATVREAFPHPAFPNLTFIQKGPDARGQARTLNMILDRIAGYEFWLHWEESWVCTRPFLASALDVMRTSDLTQLQITHDWLDVGEPRLVRKVTPTQGTSFVQVLPDANTGTSGSNVRHGWPLYSLRPGLNRVDFCRQVGRFDENPRMWPVKFEREFGQRWWRRGATKGVLTPHAAQLQPNHRSTYH
jgi:hypothetical protein